MCWSEGHLVPLPAACFRPLAAVNPDFAKYVVDLPCARRIMNCTHKAKHVFVNCHYVQEPSERYCRLSITFIHSHSNGAFHTEL
jgi:hypothetical protein